MFIVESGMILYTKEKEDSVKVKNKIGLARFVFCEVSLKFQNCASRLSPEERTHQPEYRCEPWNPNLESLETGPTSHSHTIEHFALPEITTDTTSCFTTCILPL
jgi:hypothetical protein